MNWIESNWTESKPIASTKKLSIKSALSSTDEEEEEGLGDEFEEEMANFWNNEKPLDQDEIDNFFEEEVNWDKHVNK